LLIVGDKEVEKNEVTVRTQKGENLGSMSINNFVDYINDVIESKK
jgi:threonyl-tRNA synthetase